MGILKEIMNLVYCVVAVQLIIGMVCLLSIHMGDFFKFMRGGK